MAALRAMTASGSASFANTKNLEELEKRMREIVVDTKKDAESRALPQLPPEKNGGSAVWTWVVAGGAVLLLGALAVVVFVLRRGGGSSP